MELETLRGRVKSGTEGSTLDDYLKCSSETYTGGRGGGWQGMGEDGERKDYSFLRGGELKMF